MVVNSLIKQFMQRLQMQVRVDDIDSLHRHRRHGISVAENSSRFHLLERSLLRHRAIELKDVSGAKWWDALRVQLQTWSPFTESNYVVLTKNQTAVVWAWDNMAFRQRCEQAGLKSRGARIIPESMLFPRLQDGVQLCAAANGYEAQFWSDGVLAASRFWENMPNAADWLNFQRGVKLASHLQQESLPAASELQTATLVPEVLPKVFNPTSTQDIYQLAKPWAMLGGGFLLVTLTSVASIDLLRYNQALQAQKVQRQQLEREAAPVLSAIDRIMQDKARVEAIQAITLRPDPIEIMAHLSYVLADSETRIRRLEWSNRQLKIALDAPPSGQRADLIRVLEASHWLTDVREVPDSLSFDIQLQARGLPLSAIGPLQIERTANRTEGVR